MKLEVQLHRLIDSIERALNGGDGQSALRDLATGVKNLRTLFSNNPAMAITGELFETTDQLNHYAVRLARHFHNEGQVEFEEQAWKSRYESVATAHAHRRNLLGPALLDWADCNLRLGNRAKADEIFETIIRDFTEILGWGPTFDPNWLVAVNCLDQAMTRSSKDFGELQVRTQELLQQSHRLAESRTAQAE